MTREVPAAEWSAFLRSFTLQHEQWLVRVTGLAGEEPLDDVTAGDGEIAITAGGRRVVVRNPRRLRVEVDNRATRALEIEDGQGSITRIAFRTAIAPELVDGM
jgi:hypothetical protein